ncbi:MAG: phbH [Rhizobiaceae bacterium]|nr:phbH [Rhizobiaceae bacterium]
MRTQVAIIGSGPSGLLLGQLLSRAGIDNVILDRASRAHILERVRAGLLEEGTVGLIEQCGGASRLHAEALTHDGISLAFDGSNHRIDLHALTGKRVTVYGQTELTRDLMDHRQAAGGQSVYEAADVLPNDIDGDRPHVTYRSGGVTARLDCDFVAGCDGFHGVSRACVPPSALTTYERVYPFGWLGILADVPPADRELIYAYHPRGFALCTMRSPQRSRYYIQCGLDDGSLFLVGDPAHIVPPTGAKGLNLAASDVHYLISALREFYAEGSRAGIDAYSARALSRVWKAVRFSWSMTLMLHQFPENGAFGRRMQEAELAYLVGSRAASAALAENYVGLPY